MIRLIFGITCLAVLFNIQAAQAIEKNVSDSIPHTEVNKPIGKKLIAPVSLLVAGTAVSTFPGLKKLELRVYNGFNPDRRYTAADDYIQYIPALAVLAADACGAKGIHKPKHQILLYGMSSLGTAAIVQSMKRIIGRERPDGSDNRSFPSGHTSTAFAAAEFLHQEFGHHSTLISIAGYTAAAVTGYLRMYNNAHWLGDVLAGAAIGMGTTKMVYWIKQKRSLAIQKKIAIGRL
jgi:membrane-associated phospholipid phosphatase